MLSSPGEWNPVLSERDWWSAEEILARLVASLTWLRASKVQDSCILLLQCAACRLVALPNGGGDVQGL